MLADKTTLLAQKDEELAELKQELAEKEAAIADKDTDLAKKTEELAQKTAELAQKDETIQNQAGEIAEIQDKFKQLLATIEKELGSEFPVDEFIAPSATIATATVDSEPAAPAEEPAAANPFADEGFQSPAAPAEEPVQEQLEEPAPQAAEWSPDPLLQDDTFDTPAAEPAAEAVKEPAAEESVFEAPALEEPAPEEKKDDFVEDPSLGPIVDMTMSRDDEEDELPEIHGANEKDNDLFASREGSQGNFFG